MIEGAELKKLLTVEIAESREKKLLDRMNGMDGVRTKNSEIRRQKKNPVDPVKTNLDP